MGDVIPFPKRQPSRYKIRVMAGPNVKITVKCDDFAHSFTDVPGYCDCGEVWWDGEDDDA